ncbi:hypothetical protein Tco_0862956 [Tanacetum coccineum]
MFKKQKITDVPDVTKNESVKREGEFKVLILRRIVEACPHMDERCDENLLQRSSNGSIPARSSPKKFVNWQILKTGKKRAYQIIREDHTNVVYVNFQGLLNDLTRDDLKELYRLMMLKYGDSRPEEEYERVLWGDLKTMFNPPSTEDAVWSLTHQQKVRLGIFPLWLWYCDGSAYFIVMKSISYNLAFSHLAGCTDGLEPLVIEKQLCLPPIRRKYHWSVANATGCRAIKNRKWKRYNHKIQIPIDMYPCRVEEKMTWKVVDGKTFEEIETKIIAKDGTVTKILGKFQGYETSKEELVEQPRSYDLYGFVDHPQLQQGNPMDEFAPHRLPQPEGNMNGLFIEDDEELERDEVDLDLESTASQAF